MRFFWPFLCVGLSVALLHSATLVAEARKRKTKAKANADKQQERGIDKIQFTQSIFQEKKNSISAMPDNAIKWAILVSEMLSLGSTKVQKITGGGEKCLKAAISKSFVYSNVPTFRPNVDVRVVLLPVHSVKIETETRLLLKGKCMSSTISIEVVSSNESQTSQFREYSALLGKKGDVRELNGKNKDLTPGTNPTTAQELVDSLYGTTGGEKGMPVIFVAAQASSRDPGKLDITGNVETFVAVPCGLHARDHICVPGVLHGSGKYKKKVAKK